MPPLSSDPTDEENTVHRRLAELEEHYTILAELGSEWAYVFRLHPDGTSQQLWSGGAFEKITGHYEADMNARDTWRDIVHPDDLPIIETRTQQLLAGCEDASEYRIFTRDGTTRWVVKRSRPLPQDDGTMLVYCMVRDITDAKQAEYDQRRLLAQERVHSAVLEISSSDDLSKITNQIAAELKALDISYAGVGLNLFDAAAHTITAYDIYEGALEHQAVMPAATPSNAKLVEYWRRGEVWERELDKDHEDLIAITERPYYHPAVIIDVPFLRGTLAVGLTESELGENTDLIELLESFCRSLSLAFQRIQDTAKRRALQDVREAVWKMDGEEALLKVMEVVEQSLRAIPIAFRNCAIHIVDTSNSPPQIRTQYKDFDSQEWIRYDTLPETAKIILEMWYGDEPVYRRDLHAEDRHDEQRNINAKSGTQIRSVLDMPFSHGLLAINSPQPSAFADEDIAFLHELVNALSEGFRRLDDLRQLEEQHRLLLGFHQVGRAILSSLDLDEILDILTEQIVRAGVFRSLMTALVDEEAGTVTPVRNWVRKLDDKYNRHVVRAAYTFNDDGILAWVVRWGQMEVIEGWDERFDATIDSPASHVDKVSYFIPVKQGERVLAILATASTYAEKEAVLKRIDTMAPLLDLVAIALEHARIYQELTTSQEVLRQAQKMEVIGQLAGGVAHDFNNMLTAILISTETLLQRTEIDEVNRAEIDIIHEASLQAAAITHQLLAFSRRQVLRPEQLNLNALVNNTTAMAKRLIGEHVQLRTILDPGLDAVSVDPGQMSQVLLNLIVNARDAMPSGGRLTITTRNLELNEEQAGLIDLDEGTYVMLEVVDAGTGMDQETRDRIFEPFFTTKEAGRGTGLGLSTVYGIVKQSGGHIEVCSAPGQGSTFGIYLPSVGTTGIDRAGQQQKQEGPTAGGTILVAEDEEIVRRTVCSILALAGYEVIDAGDGHQALAHAADHPGTIDLLLTDIDMPNIDGPQLARQLSAIRTDLKVIYMSGHDDERLDDESINGESIRFLQKPFTAEILVEQIRDALLNT